MGTEISYANYQSVIEDYAAARSLILLSLDYLETAVDVIVALDEVIPEVDLLQDFWDTYQIAVDTLGSLYNFVQAVRSIQNHIVNRGDEDNVNDWLDEEGGSSATVPEEWADLSEAAGFTYDSDNIGGPIFG